MFYLENYGPYAELINTGKVTIYSKDINRNNWNMHFDSILNIMRDGIETPEIQHSFITIIFDNGMDIDLSVMDYWYNLVMWYVIVRVGDSIEPKHIFFDHAITSRTIKKYIDVFFISRNMSRLDNITLNNIIDDCISKYAHIDEFSYYLCNTINLEDFVELMKNNKEFYDILHLNLEGIPLDMVKQKGMEATKRAVEIMENSDHCLANFFRAKEGVNIKQFKEFAVNIGTKPDGNGGVYPIIINKNFISGGVNDMPSFFIESSTGRTAQIIVDGNVGDSGHFARLLGLNNSDSFIHLDQHYDCHTANFEIITIKDDSTLSKLKNRYYRLNPKGMEYIISEDDSHLIGQTIYLRSPMTCASASRDEGICYKCYGNLAYINKDINIGKMASELVSSVLTQMMLSAKHLLEAAVRKVVWSPGFTDLFEIEYNSIRFIADKDLTGYKIKVDIDDYDSEDDDINMDAFNYNEYITKFTVIAPDGSKTEIFTSDLDNLYLTGEFAKALDITYDEPTVIIDAKQLKDMPLLVIQVCNNDLSKTLNRIKNILDKKAVTESLDRNQLLQTLLDTLNEGGLDVDSVHAEIILMNQIRSTEDILLQPRWEYPNEPCKILTLKGALERNPSVTISLAFEKISRTLASPLTYRKTKPSHMDLFYMEQPQVFLKKGPQEAIKREVNEDGLLIPITRIKE